MFEDEEYLEDIISELANVDNIRLTDDDFTYIIDLALNKYSNLPEEDAIEKAYNEATTRWASMFSSNKLITNADVTLDKDDLFGGDESNPLGRAMKRAGDVDRAEKKQARRNALTGNALEVIEALEGTGTGTVEEKLKVAFDKLVPGTGPAESKAGELVRAINKIIYRDYNDGDVFFTGYGKEVLGSVVDFLIRNFPESEEVFQEIVDNYYNYTDDNSSGNDNYTDRMYSLADSILTYIANNPDLIETPNDDNMDEYSTEFVDENEPKDEFYVLLDSIDYVDFDDYDGDPEGWVEDMLYSEPGINYSFDGAGIQVYDVPIGRMEDLEREIGDNWDAYMNEHWKEDEEDEEDEEDF